MPVIPAPSPHISTYTAHILALFFSLSYVGSLYVSKNGRLSFKHASNHGERYSEVRGRDDPQVIKTRMAAVCASTLLSLGIVFCVIWYCEGGSREALPAAYDTTLARLGFTWRISSTSSAAIIWPCLIAPVLFVGPLYTTFLYGHLPFQRFWQLKPYISTWIGWRNYITGPITEELVFRACTLAVYSMSGASRWKMVFLSPLTFGLAHAHHGWELYNRLGRTNSALKRAAISVFFQLLYTSLFGFHCSYLFLRTGSIIPPIISHIFCNVMGFPDMAGPTQHFPKQRYVIMLLFVSGIVGYIYTVGRWTEVEHSLFWYQMARSS